jgi:ferredoxin
MPEIIFGKKKIHCEPGANLRKVLIDNGIYPHNGASRFVNCFGLGSCGTCAVKIIGKVEPLNATEKLRLAMPPHRIEDGLRLACQIKVTADLQVLKFDGFWGQLTPRDAI